MSSIETSSRSPSKTARLRARLSARARRKDPPPGRASSVKISTGACALRQMSVSKQSSDSTRTPCGARSSRVARPAAATSSFMASGPSLEREAHLVERRFLDLADPRGTDAEGLADLLEVHLLDEIELHHHGVALGQGADRLGDGGLQPVAVERLVRLRLDVGEPHAMIRIDLVDRFLVHGLAVVDHGAIIGGA